MFKLSSEQTEDLDAQVAFGSCIECGSIVCDVDVRRRDGGVVNRFEIADAGAATSSRFSEASEGSG